MSSVEKEYYEYLDKISKEDLIDLVMSTEMEKNERIKELEEGIKVKDGLIEQLENQNDRLIAQRDNYEQKLKLYKKAFEFICNEALFNDIFDNDRKTRQNWFLEQAKKELEKKDE